MRIFMGSAAGEKQVVLTLMNWHRLGKLALVAIGTFAAIAIAALVFISLIAPTVTPARMVAFMRLCLPSPGQ